MCCAHCVLINPSQTKSFHPSDDKTEGSFIRWWWTWTFRLIYEPWARHNLSNSVNVWHTHIGQSSSTARFLTLTFSIILFLVQRRCCLPPDSIRRADTVLLTRLTATQGWWRLYLLVLRSWRRRNALAEVVWWPGVTVTFFHAVSTQDWNIKTSWKVKERRKFMFWHRNNILFFIRARETLNPTSS